MWFTQQLGPGGGVRRAFQREKAPRQVMVRVDPEGRTHTHAQDFDPGDQMFASPLKESISSHFLILNTIFMPKLKHISPMLFA